MQKNKFNQMNLQSYTFRLLLIIALAFALPSTFDLIFNDKPDRVQCYYSVIKKQFITSSNFNYTDQQGNAITRDTFEASLPFIYFQRLLINGVAPDTIEGIKMSAELVSNTQKFFRLVPRNLHKPNIKIFPLVYKSPNNPATKIRFFAFNNGLKVLNAKSNSIDVSLTKTFNELLTKNQFQHPAKLVYGTISKKNITNEGMFIIDAADHFFNLSINQDVPSVEIIPIPKGRKIVNMVNTTFKDRSSYGVVIDDENNFYLLETGSFRFIKLPIDNYNTYKDEFSWAGNILTTTVNIYKDSVIEAIAFDSFTGELIDKYSIKRDPSKQVVYNKYKEMIFPFIFSTSSHSKQFIKLYTTVANYKYWLLNSFLSLLIYLALATKRRNILIRDIIMIAVCGSFGLITYLLLGKKA